MHADHSADFNLLFGSCICKGSTLLDLSLVDSNVGELAKLTFLEFESKANEGFLVINLSLNFLVILCKVESVVFNFGWVR